MDMTLGQQIHIFNHTEIIRDAVFSSDSKCVLAVTSRQLISWDIISGEIIRDINITGLYATATFLKISKDGKFLAMAMGEESIQIYNVAEGTKTQILFRDYGSIQAINWSNDSKFLYIDSPNLALLWDVARGTPKMEFDQDAFNRGHLNISKDSKLITFIDGVTREIVIWDLDRSEKFLTIVADHSLNDLTIFEFSNDSTLLAVAQYSFVGVWDITTGRRQHNLKLERGNASELRWFSGSEALAVIFRDSVEVYDLTEHIYWDFENYTEPARQVMFSPDFTLVAAGCSDLTVWNSTTGSEIQTFHANFPPLPYRLQFSHDSTGIYGYYYDSLKSWNIGSHSLIPTSSKGPAVGRNQSAFSSDGRYCALATDGVQLWNLATNETASHLMTRQADVAHLALSHNATFLVLVYDVTGDIDFTSNIGVWSLATGKKIWTVDDAIDRGRYTDIHTCDICGGWRRSHQYRSIAISDGGMALYIRPFLHEMVIWSDGKTILKLPACLQRLEPYFDIESPYIVTQLGRLHLDKVIAEAESSPFENISDYQSMTEGYGISSNDSWITWKGENILWLPPDYRPAVQRAISRHCIAIGTISKGVPIFNFFSPPPFELLY
jgi:WD40 repeat protein